MPNRLSVQGGSTGIADFVQNTNLYNGQYIPDVWQINPGDTVKTTVDVTNMDRTSYSPDVFTNLHLHGFNVSPLPNQNDGGGKGDDIYLMIDQANPTMDYSVPVPAAHPVGSFWFHPHPHGLTEPQVLGGLSGLAVVGNLSQYFPALQPYEQSQQFFLLKDYLPNGAPCLEKTINGVPTGMVNDGSSTTVQLSSVNVVAGQLNLWRFANVGADQYFDIVLIDENSTRQTMYVVAIDGNVTGKTNGGSAATAFAIPMTHLFLAPGARMDVVVRLDAGDYNIWSDAYDTGSTDQTMLGDSNCAVQLAYVSSAPSGNARRADEPLNVVLASNVALSRPAASGITSDPDCASVTQISFDETPTSFMINKAVYAEGAAPIMIAAPCTVQWPVLNNTPEAHVFHIHQIDFIVPGGDPSIFSKGNLFDPSYVVYQDTLNLPPQTSTGPTTLQVLLPFTDDIIKGAFVLHCHILNHEDGGMMADVCVPDQGTKCSNLPQPATGHAMKH